MRRFAFSLIVLATCGAATRAAAEPRNATCLGRSFTYELVAPGGDVPRPALVLLHGAGGSRLDLVKFWLTLADREHLVLIAPQLPLDTAFEAIAPAVLRCIVGDAMRATAINPRRIYLFGYSMGGYLAFDASMFESELFLAVGVYAAAIADGYEGIVDHATRKVPIALYIGDRDQFYSVAQVKRTRDLLVRRGFDVRYTEFAGQDHAYAPVSSRINEDVWRFFASHER